MHERQSNQPGDAEEGGLPGSADSANSLECDDDARPSIWVGSLLDYNAGILHGAWIDAVQTPEQLADAGARILATSPTARETGDLAEELAIFDYEGFGQLRIGEYESFDYIATVAAGITEHGSAFAAWAEARSADRAADLEGFEDAYLGRFDSLLAYAEQLVDDLGYEQLLDQVLPAHVRLYTHVDTAGLARDLELGGDVWVSGAPDGGVYLFDGRL